MSRTRIYTLITLTYLLLPLFTLCQTVVKGRVISDDDSSPIAYASIGIKNREAGCVADSSGNFILELPAFVKQTDSLIISSIGYERSGFVVGKVKSSKEFRLKGASRDLKAVIINSHFKEMKFGNAKDESFLFFRSWGAKGTAGEIGQVMHLPYINYSIKNIQIRIDNKYDTCWVRLHIRKVLGNNMPDEELLKENIIKPVYSTTSNDNIEFDLSDKNIEMNTDSIFIGFEVLDCRSKDEISHSVCFVGSEYGQHVFKPFANSKWDVDGLFSIHIKMLLKY